MIIKNIYMLNPTSGFEGITDIYIRDGKIAELGKDLNSTGEDEIIDGAGLTAAPGLVDAHVHFREPGFEYKESIQTGAGAAAAGGFTSVVMMANTKPVIDNPETLEYVLNKGAETGIHIYSCGSVTEGLKGKKLTDMQTLRDMGAVGFTDDGIPIKNEEVVKDAMRQAESLGAPLSFHEENPEYISENGINAGKASEYYKIKGSPRQAEISMIKRDIELAKGIPADIIFQHISAAESVELIREARKNNPHIHGEVTPHHFTLTEDAVIKKGSLAKMNPPLRTEADRQALIEGLRDGSIEIISTDHAPHSEEEKAVEITKVPSGIIGLETSLGLGIRELVIPGYISLMELIGKMSANPARLYGLDAGYLAEGAPADLVIFSPEEKWKVGSCFKSKASNSPFIGEELPGRIYMTICGGKVVYRG